MVKIRKEVVLEARDVSMTFNQGTEREVNVFRGINFELHAGEILAIIGPSGCGKSTLFNIIAGLLAPTAGAVHVDGEVVDGARGHVGYMLQKDLLLPWRTAAENLTLVHPGLSRAGAMEALAQVGIADKADLFPRQLSLGQQRRVALARAFAGAPQALILDEPFASLDPATADEMLALTERLIAGARPATLFVTHAEAEARRLASRVLRLPGRPATIATNGGGA